MKNTSFNAPQASVQQNLNDFYSYSKSLSNSYMTFELCGYLRSQGVPYSDIAKAINPAVLNIAMSCTTSHNDSNTRWMFPSTDKSDDCFIVETGKSGYGREDRAKWNLIPRGNDCYYIQDANNPNNYLFPSSDKSDDCYKVETGNGDLYGRKDRSDWIITPRAETGYFYIQDAKSGRYMFPSSDKKDDCYIVEVGDGDKYGRRDRSKWGMNLVGNMLQIYC